MESQGPAIELADGYGKSGTAIPPSIDDYVGLQSASHITKYDAQAHSSPVHSHRSNAGNKLPKHSRVGICWS